MSSPVQSGGSSVSVVSWPAGMLGVERPTSIRLGLGLG
jgi:hypothetical protein